MGNGMDFILAIIMGRSGYAGCTLHYGQDKEAIWNCKKLVGGALK
jgi:hypothetical protein